MTYEDFAEIYDELIYEDVDYDNMTEVIKSIVGKHIGNEDYLDLACGTGSLAIRVAKDFKNIYAVDISEEMLQKTDEKFRNNNIQGNIICQNMMELELNHKFDLITCMLDSINYLIEEEDLKKSFQKIYEHLKDGGISSER